MFDQIGTKIKKVAKIFYTIGKVSSIIAGVILFFMAFVDWDYTWFLLIAGPAIAAIGWLVSWLSVLCIYGFGELIEKADAIEKLLQKEAAQKSKREPEAKAKREADEKAKREAAIEREIANIEYVDIKCPNCHEPLSFEKGTSKAQCPFCNFEFNIDE